MSPENKFNEAQIGNDMDRSWMWRLTRCKLHGYKMNDMNGTGGADDTDNVDNVDDTDDVDNTDNMDDMDTQIGSHQKLKWAWMIPY